MAIRAQVRRFSSTGGKNNDEIRLLSRNLKPLDQHFQELIPCLLALPAENFLLDGEIVIFDSEGRSRFQLLQSRLGIGTRSHSKEETGPARYLVFDVLSCDGFDLRQVTLSERRRILEALVPQSELIKKVDVVAQQGESFFRLVEEQGLEGIVAKQAGSYYVSGRSSRWLKIKTSREQSFVIGGFTAPSRSRKHFGALALGLFDGDRLRFVGKVGGGFNAETLRTVYHQMNSLQIEKAPFQEIPREIAGAGCVKPTLVCDVKFNEWTRDWILRAPVFLKLRPELEATECRFEGGPDGTAAGSDEDDGLEQYDFLSHLDKPFWAREGYTKRDLVDYYHRIAPVLLPYLKDRPLNLERYPNGYQGKSFYQKDAPDFLPDWIDTAVVPSGSKGKANRHVLCNDRRTLVYLANLACIPLHPWSSRAGSIEFPDFMIVDLDPGEGVPFPAVCQLALTVKEILGQLSLNSYPKTSGSKGLHVVVPLDSGHDYKSVRRFAEVIARLALHSMGELATIERGVEKRKGKIYIDYLQNGFGKTIVSPYCLRARPGAPVSTPLHWSEVSSSIRPQAFNIRSIFRRLAAKGDPFRPLLTEKQSLQKALQQLEDLFSDGSL